MIFCAILPINVELVQYESPIYLIGSIATSGYPHSEQDLYP
jgi:hypothetical protein